MITSHDYRFVFSVPNHFAFQVVIPGAVEFAPEKCITEFLEGIHNKSLQLRNESNRKDCKVLHLNQPSILPQ